MAYEPDVSEIRTTLEMARALGKARIGFVIMPARDKDDYVKMLVESAKRYEELAVEAENADQ